MNNHNVKDDDALEAADAEWRAIIEKLMPMGRNLVAQLQDPHDRQLRYELYRNTFSAIATGYLALANTSSDYPEFIPFCGIHQLNLLGPNPDWVYSMCPIDDTGTYRLYGYLGNAFRTMVQFGSGSFVTEGNGESIGRTLVNYTVDEFPVDPDGAFSVIISAERPRDYSGEWRELPRGATYVVQRSFGIEWINQEQPLLNDARIAIERLDRPAEKPRENADELRTALEGISRWAQTYVSMSMQWAHRFRDLGTNALHLIDFAEDGGMPTQAYFEGQWEMAEDEAIIVETAIPEEYEYWSLHLLDENWSALDYYRRKTHINHASASVTNDHKFLAVISPVDPGIQNWLDSMGYLRGLLQVRWHSASHYPKPELKVVKQSELAGYLGNAGKPVTSESRTEDLRRTNISFQLRRRW